MSQGFSRHGYHFLKTDPPQSFPIYNCVKNIRACGYPCIIAKANVTNSANCVMKPSGRRVICLWWYVEEVGFNSDVLAIAVTLFTLPCMVWELFLACDGSG